MAAWTGRPIRFRPAVGRKPVTCAASLRPVTHQWMQPEREAAVSLIEGGIDRTDLRRASALGERRSGRSRVADVTGDRGRGGAGPGAAPVLQSGVGRVEGRYLRSTLETVRWGALPGADSVPAATVESGAVVTVDTISHEGILEDQGRDPVAYFGRYGIAPRARARRRPRPGRVQPRARRPVRRQRPDRRARRRAGRRPARRRARARPARALRRRLQPPRGRRRAHRHDRSRPSAGPTTATAATCRSRASCAPSSRSTRTWGSWAWRATS